MTEVNLKDLYQMFYEDPDFSGGLGGNPDDSKEEAAWEEAQSRFKQHKNNEKALKVGINHSKASEAKTDRKNLIRRKLLRQKQMQKQSGEIKKDLKFGLPKFPKKKPGDKFTTPRPIKTLRRIRPGLPPAFSYKSTQSSEVIKQSGDITHPKKPISKDKNDMNTVEMVVNGVMKDLLRKGIIKSKGLEKAIPVLNKEEMSVPAIAGLVGAGAMLAKIFKLEDDGDDEHISKQVVSYMNKNEDFFDGLAQMCEFICSVKDGEEPCDESRGNRVIEAASAFHKQCGGAGAAPAGGVGTWD